MDRVVRLQAVREILRRTPQRINKIYLAKESHQERFREIIALSRQANIPVVFVPRQRLDQMSSNHQGIVALISPKEFVSLESILEESACPFVVFLDEIEDPQNLGAIIRSAEAAGVDGLILPERHSVGLTSAVYQASAGALEYTKIARVKNLTRAIEEVKGRGLWVIGAEAGGKELWFEFDYTLPVALVFGSEGRGLRRLVREHCDRLLSIPLAGHINSLNVAAAATVFFFEVLRQRRFKKT